MCKMGKIKSKKKRKIPLLTWLVTGGLFFGGTGEKVGWAQTLPEQEPQPEWEERLRKHLRKLDQWGVLQLLRTERDVDKQQKKRARYSTHPEELGLLADDEDGGVRFYVAVNRHTPLDVRLQLAFDPLSHVIAGVAMSLIYDPLASLAIRNLTEKIGQHLAQDSQPLVRLGLASNLFLSPSLFDLLAGDGDSLVRQKLAENLHIPQNTVAILGQDSVVAVQIQALQHRNAPRSLLEAMGEDGNTMVRLAVCQNLNTPLGVLVKLAADADTLVRQGVAGHPGTPLETLREMAQDDVVEVVLGVAGNPGADRELLLSLAADPRDIAIRQEAQKRLVPLLREEIREDVLERWEDP